MKNFETALSSKIKNKKKFYSSIEFKLTALNYLINSNLFDKISLYLHVFDLNIVKDKILELNCNQFLEIVTESNFKESVKNKIYFYNEKVLGNEETENIYTNKIGMISATSKNSKIGITQSKNSISTLTTEYIIDKCLICDEYLDKFSSNKLDSEKTNSNLNKYNSQIEDMQEELKEISKEDESVSRINSEDNLCQCPYCKSKYHLICLAQSAIGNQISQLCLIPKEAGCLVCGRENKWAEYLK
jgi:hypothetical protein